MIKLSIWPQSRPDEKIAVFEADGFTPHSCVDVALSLLDYNLSYGGPSTYAIPIGIHRVQTFHKLGHGDILAEVTAGPFIRLWLS